MYTQGSMVLLARQKITVMTIQTTVYCTAVAVLYCCRLVMDHPGNCVAVHFSLSIETCFHLAL